ncbi:MAG: hypothetical protein ACSHX5_06190 [Phycisphaerales bacterium]
MNTTESHADYPHSKAPTPPTPQHGGGSPLSDVHLQMLGTSVQIAKPIRKATAYARFSGWSTLLAGVASVLFSLGSLPGMVLGALLAGIGMRELGLARRLVAFDTRAPAALALNQLMFGLVLIGYAGYKIVTMDSSDGVIAGTLAADPTIAQMPELAGTMDQLNQIEYLLNIGVAGGLVVVAFVVQGGTALYYFSKRKGLAKLTKHSPEWVLRVHGIMQNPDDKSLSITGSGRGAGSGMPTGLESRAA